MSLKTDPRTREYRTRRYAERISIGIRRLGGECAICRSTDSLEFDHIDPSNKAFEVSATTWMALDRWLAEVDKCQLLCRSCHNEKSVAERGQRLARGTHGTLAAYRYCKCDACRQAKSAWQRNYQRSHSGQVAGSMPAGGTN